MENHLIERVISTDNAEKLIRSELASHRLTPTLESYGKDVKTYRCNLVNDSGNEVATGAGKGTGSQSVTSALFETFEHYLQSAKKKIEGIYQHSEIKYLSVNELAAQDKIAEEKPIETLMRKSIDEKIPCQKFTSLDGSSTLFYPLILTIPAYLDLPLDNDNFDYTIMAKYGSNNGAGIGVGFEEAAIHAINEALERDAQATNLLTTFIKNDAQTPRLVNTASIPDRLKEIVQIIVAEFKSDLKIVDITNDFEVPAFRVHFVIPNFPKPIFGMGASLSKEYALERALLEALQVAHIVCATPTTHPFIVRENEGIKRVQSLPKYYNCVTYNIDKLVASRQPVELDYNELKTYDVPIDLHHYLALVDGLVRKNGYCVYTSTHFRSLEGIVALHIVIPGTEKFFLVESGEYVLPSERGRKLLQSNCTTL